MLSQPSARLSMEIPAPIAETMNTARLHGSSFNYLHHQSLPPTPHMLPAQADTAFQSWSPSSTTSPYIPAPVLASSLSPSLSNFSPPLLSPQPTPLRAQSTASTNTMPLSPSRRQDYYFTEPYQPLKRKVDGRKCNCRKTLKQLKARKEEERERAQKLLQKTS
ncbi:hypothetical protein EDD21DRAFT_371843 [Dissophora ornata]|nr:hypothetical protein EDD21DRAFT_371843 [Dissophora ornata]